MICYGSAMSLNQGRWEALQAQERSEGRHDFPGAEAIQALSEKVFPARAWSSLG